MAVELKSHFAFYSHLTNEGAEKLLVGTLPMTYMLWAKKVVKDGAIVEQFYLSYTMSNLKVAHLTFGDTQTLSELIPQMCCDPHECKMLLNPNHFRKHEC